MTADTEESLLCCSWDRLFSMFLCRQPRTDLESYFNIEVVNVYTRLERCNVSVTQSAGHSMCGKRVGKKSVDK